MLTDYLAAFGGALAAVTPETPGLAVTFATIGGFGIGGVLVPAVSAPPLAAIF